MSEIDSLPYKTFLKLKEKYSTKMILVTEGDFLRPGVHQAFKSHRDYIDHEFKKVGVEVYRWNTNYKTLTGPNPELGLTYLMNDSVIVPGFEVWALIGHNARWIPAEEVK